MANYTIPNLRNACRTLSHIATREEALSLSQLAAELDVPRTTMLRIVCTLEEQGFLVKDANGYRTGPVMLQLGLKAVDRVDIRSCTGPVLKRLATATGETAHIAQRAGNQMLILDVSDGPNVIRVASRPGTQAHMHCSATGKVILANAIEDLSSFIAGLDLQKRTRKTITRKADLLKELATTRQRGYGLDDGEYHESVRCLAVPVRDSQNQVIAGIGITASTTTFPKSRIPEIVQKVKSAARDLESALRQPDMAKV
ncbi:MAG: IclR family transcriptional regulator [Puniceicoccaceae bacterium]